MVDPGNIAVSLRNVRKVFANGIRALERFNLDVWSGEFVSLLGPSGCGKSTVLRIIAGLIKPTAGAMEWPLAPAAARIAGEIGFVFQEPTLMPWATAAGNVRLPLELQGLPTAQAVPRVEAALARVGLAGFAGSYPREISG